MLRTVLSQYNQFTFGWAWQRRGVIVNWKRICIRPESLYLLVVCCVCVCVFILSRIDWSFMLFSRSVFTLRCVQFLILILHIRFSLYLFFSLLFFSRCAFVYFHWRLCFCCCSVFFLFWFFFRFTLLSSLATCFVSCHKLSCFLYNVVAMYRYQCYLIKYSLLLCA